MEEEALIYDNTDEEEEENAGKDAEVAGFSSRVTHRMGNFMYDITADELLEGSDSDY